MRILFIQPTADKRGHYGVYTVNLCQELARLGNEVTLFTNRVSPEKFIAEKPLFEIMEVEGGKYGFKKFDEIRTRNPLSYHWGYLKNSFLVLGAALELLKERTFDIVQLLDTEYGILSWLLRNHRAHLPPTVLLVQAANFSFSHYGGPLWLKVYKPLQREILRRRIGCEIRALVVLGEYQQEELKKQFKLSDDFPIRVIYDGANPPAFFLSSDQARKKIGITYPGPLFLFFGILRKDKGLEYLLEAATVLADKDFKILIAGAPFDYQPEEILELIKKFRLEDKVVLELNYIESGKVPFYFYAADALVLPYRKLYTGGSGPLLKEAAIFKTPVIVSEVSEMGRLVKKHQMGLLVNPEDPLSLAEKMKAFLEMSQQERQRLAENAFLVASTWEKMAKEYLQLYKEIYAKKV